jgi:hypothetical protein
MDRLESKRINLKSKSDNLIEENKYKDYQIKKLEEELSSITKEYMDLQMNFQNMKESKSSMITDQFREGTRKVSNILSVNKDEYRLLTEERNNLQRELALLNKKMESLEGDMRYKFISKQEFEKKVMQLENERNSFSARFRTCEMQCEKFKREIQFLKVDKEELKKEVEKWEKKCDDMKDHIIPVEDNQHAEIPLNMMLDDEFENYDQRHKYTFSKLKRGISNTGNQNNTENEAERRSPVGSENNISENNQEQILYQQPNLNYFKPPSFDNMIPTPKSGKSIGSFRNKFSYPSIPEQPDMEHKPSENNSLIYDTNLHDISNTFLWHKDNEIEEGKKVNLGMTSRTIVNQMSNNDFSTMSPSKSNNLTANFHIPLSNKDAHLNAPINSHFNSQISPRTQYTQKKKSDNKLINIENINININQKKNPYDHRGPNLRHSLTKIPNAPEDAIYREFFNLTFQAFKLNSQKIEPFLYVSYYC